MADDPKDEIPADAFGIGILDDGTLLVVPPGALKARIAARDREESEDPEDGDPAQVDALAAEYDKLLEG